MPVRRRLVGVQGRVVAGGDMDDSRNFEQVASVWVLSSRSHVLLDTGNAALVHGQSFHFRCGGWLSNGGFGLPMSTPQNAFVGWPSAGVKRRCLPHAQPSSTAPV